MRVSMCRIARAGSAGRDDDDADKLGAAPVLALSGERAGLTFEGECDAAGMAIVGTELNATGGGFELLRLAGTAPGLATIGGDCARGATLGSGGDTGTTICGGTNTVGVDCACG